MKSLTNSARELYAAASRPALRQPERGRTTAGQGARFRHGPLSFARPAYLHFKRMAGREWGIKERVRPTASNTEFISCHHPPPFPCYVTRVGVSLDRTAVSGRRTHDRGLEVAPCSQNPTKDIILTEVPILCLPRRHRQEHQEFPMGFARHVRRVSPRLWFYFKFLRYKFYNGEPESGQYGICWPRPPAIDVGSSIGSTHEPARKGRCLRG